MLFTPYRLGSLTLPNRIIMPPMTRSRSGPGNVPTELMAQYYAQRAAAGLIITEGTQVSQQGQRLHHAAQLWWQDRHGGQAKVRQLLGQLRAAAQQLPLLRVVALQKPAPMQRLLN